MTPSIIRKLIEKLRVGAGCAVFIGAGGSVCAGIPAAGGIIKILRRRHGRAVGATYSEVMRAAFRTKADRRAFFESLCAGKTPCLHHYQMAELADRGIFKLVYTTNFDRLIETAYVCYCSVPPSVYLHDAEFGEAELQDRNAKVVKLHGDFLFEAIANVPTELRQKLHANMRRKLLTCLRDQGLVIVGYGGGDETIMAFLEEVVDSPGSLAAGLWWVGLGPRNQLPARVAALLAHARRLGKGGFYIRSAADTFFDTLCAATGKRVRKPPRFALRTDRNVPPLVGSTPILAHARHVLPGSPTTCLDRASTTISAQTTDIGRRLRAPGTLWLVGAWPHSAHLLEMIVRKQRPRPLFYFDYRFARNQPPATNLFVDLARFGAKRLDPFTGGQSQSAVIRHLFSLNAILVFANGLRIANGSGGTHQVALDRAYWEEIYRIVALRRESGRGNVVFIEPCEPTSEILKGIGWAIAKLSAPQHGMVCFGNSAVIGLGDSVLTIGGPQRPEDVGVTVLSVDADLDIRGTRRSASEKDNRILRRMLLLRFGETRPALAKLTGEQRLGKALERLVATQAVELQGDRYRACRDGQVAAARKVPKTTHREIARQFERMATDASRGHDLNGDHYALEAEYHYLRAGRPDKAAAVLADIGGGLASLASGDWAPWVADTLADLFRMEGSGKRVISCLAPDRRHVLLRVFQMACARCDLSPDKEVVAGRDRIVSELPAAFRLIDAGKALEASLDYSEAIRQFEQVAQMVEKRGPSLLLGHAQSAIAQCYYNLSHSHERASDLNQGRKWSAAARRTFRDLGLADEEATAIDNLAFYNLQRNNHKRGLNLALRAARILQRLSGFSRDKGVVYNNVAVACLMGGDIERAEGYFLESALHYATVSEFDGLSRLYFALFQYSDNLPRGYGLTKERVYEAAFRTWGYDRPPRLTRSMLNVNEIYFQWALQKRRPVAAARAIEDFGYIAQDASSDRQVNATLPRIARFRSTFGKGVLRRVLLRRLQTSRWWTDEEKEALLAAPTW